MTPAKILSVIGEANKQNKAETDGVNFCKPREIS